MYKNVVPNVDISKNHKIIDLFNISIEKVKKSILATSRENYESSNLF